jgi:transcriptional regulator with XRE-family HTH domain
VTGEQLRAIRQALGLSISEFARALGFEGENASLALRRLERGEKTIAPKIARLACMYGRFGIPDDLR